ncbi:MAG: hypothetical protein JWO22_3025 [Frankiales bacterium]|nr:hypothetical protein [Frankiales bacterium]
MVLLCRDCCCGTAQKHPRTDHDAQLTSLTAAASDNPAVEVRLVDCLDECDRSNVAVVRRPRAPRKQRDTWFGGLLTDAATDAFADWVRDGAPDHAIPAKIRGLTFRHLPPRKDR